MKTNKFYQCPKCGAVLMQDKDGKHFWQVLNVVERTAILIVRSSNALVVILGRCEIINTLCIKCKPAPKKDLDLFNPSKN